MPASVVSATAGVSGALRLALAEDAHPQDSEGRLESRLGGGARASLLTPVHFEEAGQYHHRHLLHPLKTKYLLLMPDDAQDAAADAHAAKSEQENSLPTPKRVLFPLTAVRHGFRQGWQTGSGMQNIGNTCYLNSTLQALFHVSAFANWLVSENHGEKCTQQSGGCIICWMRKTLVDTQNNGGSIKPWYVYSNLRLICRHLIPGRQEDAHEFLRYLVEAMEKTYLSQSQYDCKQLDQYSKETTPLNQILGGYLRSVVRCLACGRVSTTFQHFQDLLVDARKASTIDEALEYFFSRERLEDLGYKCEFCNKKVSATKQFYIERAPMVLCIALKRFSITGGKLTKHVQFKQRLSLNKFMHNQNSSQQLGYRLVSLVTHLGQSQNCGHYTAVGYGPSGSFYQFDDSCVREIPITSVLNTNAYIMFYELCSTTSSPNKNNAKTATLSSSQTLKESKENIPNSIGSLSLKPFKSIPYEVHANKANGVPESHLSEEKNTNLKSKSINSILFSKTSNYKNNENGVAESSKEKTILKINETKVNGSSNGTHVLNKITYFNLNSSSSSGDNANSSQNGKATKAVFNNSPVTNGKSTNDKNSKPSNDHKSHHVQNGDQKHAVQNKSMNGNHKNESKNHEGKPVNGQKTLHVNGSSNDSVKTNGKKSSALNGSTASISSLVPYDSDGENHEDSDDEKNNSDKNGIDSSTTTKATSQGWKVSLEKPDDRVSANNQKSQLNNRSPSSEESKNNSSNSQKDKETSNQLQRLSHRGYGAPVNSWNGTHAQLNRQVFEDKKSELKRAAEADDEMDRGRVKKVRYNNYNNKYYNGRHNNYNPFQDGQNHLNKWGSKNGFKKFYHYNRSFKHKSRGRFGSQYSRHHSNGHYHQQYNRNH